MNQVKVEGTLEVGMPVSVTRLEDDNAAIEVSCGDRSIAALIVRPRTIDTKEWRDAIETLHSAYRETQQFKIYAPWSRGRTNEIGVGIVLAWMYWPVGAKWDKSNGSRPHLTLYPLVETS